MSSESNAPSKTGTFVAQARKNPFIPTTRPLPPDEATVVTASRREDVFLVEEVLQAWERIYEEAGLTNDADKTRFANEVYGYFILNGTSPQATVTRSVNIGGKEVPFGIVSRVLGADLRRFFRAQAQEMVYILNDPRNFKLAREAAAKFGVDTDLASYAFDVSEYSKDLTAELRVRILEAKNAHIRASPGVQRRDFAEVLKPKPESPRHPQHREPDW